MKLDISNIVKVYNGKCGCMCGCLGKYSYNLGHNGPEPKVRSVKVIAKKVLSNPNVEFEDSWAFVEDRAANKMQVVYFTNEASAQAAKAALQIG